MGLPELFASLTAAIWAEVGRRRARPAGARRATSPRCGATFSGCYLNALIQMAVSPPPGTPEDARALARVTLTGLGADLDRALAVPRPGLDAYTRAHLSERANASPGARRPDDPDHHLRGSRTHAAHPHSSDPSPLVQTAVYMGGMLAGYLLLTQPEEWDRVRETVREAWAAPASRYERTAGSSG